MDLGKFDSEEEAARAHDRAAVWCLGLTAATNFPPADWALQARARRPVPSRQSSSWLRSALRCAFK